MSDHRNEYTITIKVQLPVNHIQLDMTVVPDDKPTLQPDGSVQVHGGDGDNKSIEKALNKIRREADSDE